MSRWGPLVFGLRIPTDFPWALHEQYNQRVLDMAGTGATSDWIQQWTGSWLAVLFRFHACDAYGKRFTRSVARHSSAPSDLHRYRQDHDLFGFFVSGLATLDSLYYSLFAVGHLINPKTFPFTTERDYKEATAINTVLAYERLLLKESVTKELRMVCDSDEYKKLAQFRNILAHRVTPGRMIYASIGGPPAPPNELVIAGQRIPIDTSLTKSWRTWLAEVVTRILYQANGQFAVAHL